MREIDLIADVIWQYSMMGEDRRYIIANGLYEAGYRLVPAELKVLDLKILSDEELNKAFESAFDKAVNFDHKPTPEEIINIRFRAIAQATIDDVKRQLGI